MLQDFWDKYQDFLNKNAWLCTKKQNQPIIDDLNEVLPVSEGFRRTQQVVINQSPLQPPKIGSLESENFSRWHRNVFDNPKFFSSLSEEARKGVLQFYDNLDSITLIYEKIKSLGLKVVRRTNLNEQLERLVTETLTQGNPLSESLTKLNSIHDIVEADKPEPQDLASLLSSQMQNIGERAFILKGDNWYVKYDGNDNTIKALPRIRYIVRLLEKPNNKFPHRELYSLIGNQCDDINEDYSKMSKEELNAEGLSENLTMIDSLNHEELEKLEEVIYEQHIKLKFNKPNSKEEWEKTKKHLLNEHGVKMFYTHSGPYFKLMCRLTEDFEKPRSNATNNILNAIKDIEKKMPALHAHLKQHIKTGGTCRYEIQEDELIPWDIRWE